MIAWNYAPAAQADLPFIRDTYEENIASLHGVHRSDDVWQTLLADENSLYYMVFASSPVAWFRLDLEDDALWLGMLQVKPA